MWSLDYISNYDQSYLEVYTTTPEFPSIETLSQNSLYNQYKTLKENGKLPCSIYKLQSREEEEFQGQYSILYKYTYTYAEIDFDKQEGEFKNEKTITLIIEEYEHEIVNEDDVLDDVEVKYTSTVYFSEDWSDQPAVILWGRAIKETKTVINQKNPTMILKIKDSNLTIIFNTPSSKFLFNADENEGFFDNLLLKTPIRIGYNRAPTFFFEDVTTTKLKITGKPTWGPTRITKEGDVIVRGKSLAQYLGV